VFRKKGNKTFKIPEHKWYKL